MLGALLAVLGIGIGAGLVGRFVLPGRHGLVLVVWRDVKLLPRLLFGRVAGIVGVLHVLKRDIPMRWTLTAGIVGAYAGYLGGLMIDNANYDTATPWRWLLSVGGACALIVIAAASDTIERTRVTRRLHIH